MSEHFACIAEEISKINPNWDLINECIQDDFDLNFDNEPAVKEFYKAAQAIIEPKLPENLSDWYADFCNTDGWAGSLIANIDCFASHERENWIRVIKTIEKVGY